jgi:hypothetical protein
MYWRKKMKKLFIGGVICWICIGNLVAGTWLQNLIWIPVLALTFKFLAVIHEELKSVW